MANNREISQFAGLVTVADSTNNVSLGNTFLLTGNAKLGVGNDNPQAKLDVAGGAHFDTNAVNTTIIQKLFSPDHVAANRGAKIRIGLNDGSFGGIEVENLVGSNSSFNSQTVHIINHNGGIAGDIKSLTARFDGNIGIGTTNPTSKLHVIGDAKIIGNINGATLTGFDVSLGASPTTRTITITSGNQEAMQIVASAFTSGSATSAVKSFIVGGYLPGIAGQYSAATVTSAFTGGGLSISDITKAAGSFSFTMTLSASFNSTGYVTVISAFPFTYSIS